MTKPKSANGRAGFCFFGCKAQEGGTGYFCVPGRALYCPTHAHGHKCCVFLLWNGHALTDGKNLSITGICPFCEMPYPNTQESHEELFCSGSPRRWVETEEFPEEPNGTTEKEVIFKDQPE